MLYPLKGLLPLAAMLLGCGNALAQTSPVSAPEPSAAAALFTGFLVPAEATELYAPQTNFRVRAWLSDWHQVNLIELAPDGAEVKEGELVARLEFIGRNALDWINRRIVEAETTSAQAKVAAAEALDVLLMEAQRRALDAQQTALETQRESMLSKRQAKELRIRHQIAAFEVEAIADRIAARRKATDLEYIYQDMYRNSVRSDLDRYAFYQKRFDVLAPHAGIVRHVFDTTIGRKIQKGDGVAAGQRILHLAKSTALAAKFFVPEHRLREVHIGSEMLVRTPASAEAYTATITKIDYFPQELSLLMENANLPNGLENAFGVLALCTSATGDISAGDEIRVKVKSP